MTDSGSDGPSFDPRSWSGAKPDTGAAGQADPTFDPKSWSHKSASAPLKPKSSSGIPLLAGLLAAAAIAMGVVGYFAWRGLPPPHSVKVVTIRTVIAPVIPGS